MTGVDVRAIPLLDLKAQYAHIRDEVMEAIRRVAESQHFILGDEVVRFENQVAQYCSVRHAIGCASGSDALLLALMALEIGHDDEVITTPYSFFATAGSVWHRGARPVFVDIDPVTFNLDANALRDVVRAHPRARAILPVHLFGGAADLDPIVEIAAESGIPVVQDAAQSIGAEYKGRPIGDFGVMACYSFFPSKNLGAFGDGGMITTNDDALAERLRMLRVHGSRTKYVYEYVGLNSRLDALQAAVLGVKLRYLDDWTGGRQKNATLYSRLLLEQQVPVITPSPAAYQNRHIWNQYTIQSDRRDDLQAYLRSHGIGSEIYYPIPLHLQQCFSSLGYKPGEFPNSEALAKTALSLPVHSELTAEDIEAVVSRIAEFYQTV